MTDRERKIIEQLKREYESQNMSENQKEALYMTIKDAKRKSKQKKYVVWKGAGVAAAAVILVFLVIPNVSASAAHAMQSIPILGKLVEVMTFRDYQYEDERQHADIKVPEIVLDSEASVADDSKQSDVSGAKNDEQQETLKKTTEEINAEIERIAADMMKEFEENIDDIGYQDVSMSYEVLNTTEEYFTLRIICYQASGSGAEWDYYYTIDLATGERLALKDLFVEGADYITPISEDIKRQMREQMAADENVAYWVDNTDVPEWNFQAITDETNFYLDENGRLVICFNEGDVAPMYMGVVSFPIAEETILSIRK